MFAEPAKHSKIDEKFRLVVTDPKGNSSILDHTDLGIQNGSYQYILRTIYYDKKTTKFCQHLFRTKLKKHHYIELQRATLEKDFQTVKKISREAE